MKEVNVTGKGRLGPDHIGPGKINLPTKQKTHLQGWGLQMSLTNLTSKASLHQLTVLQCGEIEVCVTKTKADSSNLTSFGSGIKFLCQLGDFFVFFPPQQSSDVDKHSAFLLNGNTAC